MTIKEIESLTGIPRANIRFYEEKGLLSPARSENGYRVYEKDDVETLRRVALLRSLDVSLEEIRLLQTGEKELSRTMQEKLSVWETREKQAAHAQNVCRAIQEDRATYASLDAQKYTGVLIEPERQQETLKNDRLPYPFLPGRRFLARLLDETVYGLLWSAVLTLGFGVNLSTFSQKYGFVDTIAVLLLTLLIEPVLLHLFGTTLGKWIFGLRLETEDGARPDYQTARARTAMVLWRGEGLNIPVYALVRNWKGFKACMDGEESSWDYENSLVYTYRDTAAWRFAVMAGAWLLGLFLMLVCMMTAELPPNRGELTPAQYAENYNHFTRYYGLEGAMMLTERGTWEEFPNRDVVIRFHDPRSQPDLDFVLDENGFVQSVRYTIEIVGDSEGWIMGGPYDMAMQAALAMITAQKDAHALSFTSQRVAQKFEEGESALLPLEFTLDGVTVSYRPVSRDYYDAGGWLFADDEGDPYLKIDFEVKKQ